MFYKLIFSNDYHLHYKDEMNALETSSMTTEEQNLQYIKT